MTEQPNSGEGLMKLMSEKLDISEKNAQITKEVIDEAESIMKIGHIEAVLKHISDFCESEKLTSENVNEVINLLIVIFKAYPESEDFFKKNLKEAIDKRGIPNKKIDIDKMNPLEKIGYFFLDLQNE